MDPYFDLYRGALVALSPQADAIGSIAADGPQVGLSSVLTVSFTTPSPHSPFSTPPPRQSFHFSPLLYTLPITHLFSLFPQGDGGGMGCVEWLAVLRALMQKTLSAGLADFAVAVSGG